LHLVGRHLQLQPILSFDLQLRDSGCLDLSNSTAYMAHKTSISLLSTSVSYPLHRQVQQPPERVSCILVIYTNVCLRTPVIGELSSPL